MRAAAVLGFLAVVAPISMSPGTSLTMVVSGVTTAGRRHGWWVVAGTVTGLYVHGLLAAAGLAALVLHSAQAFRLVQAVGAAYLAGLGLWMIWSTVRHRNPAPAGRPNLPVAGRPNLPVAGWPNLPAAGRGNLPAAGRPNPPTAVHRRRSPAARRHIGLRHPYGQALLGNVLNPKAASVYLTLAPQFLLPGRSVWGPMLLLVTAHAAFVVLWLGTWVALSSAGSRLLRTDRARRAINRVGGAILVALGIRAATSLA